MNDSAEQWEKLLGRGTASQGQFTEPMKRAVLDRTDRFKTHGRQWSVIWLSASVPAVVIALFVMFGPLDDFTRQAVSGVIGGTESPGNKDAGEALPEERLQMRFAPLDAKKIGNGETIYMNDPRILPGLGDRVNPLRKADNRMIEQIPLAEVELIETKWIDGFGEAYHYRLKNDTKGKGLDYLGMKVEGYTKQGMLHRLGYGQLIPVNFETTRIFGRDAFKLSIACGIDGSICTYYKTKEDGGLAEYLSFDLDGAAYEHDLDGDGIEEAIVLAHGINEIYVFKENNEELLWASVREAMKAEEGEQIAYDPSEGIFTLTGQEASGAPITIFRQIEEVR